MFFVMNNLGNTKAMRLNFFSKCSKIHVNSKKQNNSRKIFLVFKINTFELVVDSSLYYGENAWH